MGLRLVQCRHSIPALNAWIFWHVIHWCFQADVESGRPVQELNVCTVHVAVAAAWVTAVAAVVAVGFDICLLLTFFFVIMGGGGEIIW